MIYCSRNFRESKSAPYGEVKKYSGTFYGMRWRSFPEDGLFLRIETFSSSFYLFFFINLFFCITIPREKKKLGEKWNKELSGSESSNPKCQTWTSDLKLPALFADRLQASMLMKASRKTVLRLTFKQPLYGVKWPNCQRGKPHAAFISHRFDILQRWHISTRTPTKKT